MEGEIVGRRRYCYHGDGLRNAAAVLCRQAFWVLPLRALGLAGIGAVVVVLISCSLVHFTTSTYAHRVEKWHTEKSQTGFVGAGSIHHFPKREKKSDYRIQSLSKLVGTYFDIQILLDLKALVREEQGNMFDETRDTVPDELSCILVAVAGARFCLVCRGPRRCAPNH